MINIKFEQKSQCSRNFVYLQFNFSVNSKISIIVFTILFIIIQLFIYVHFIILFFNIDQFVEQTFSNVEIFCMKKYGWFISHAQSE